MWADVEPMTQLRRSRIDAFLASYPNRLAKSGFFLIILFAIPSATVRSESGMNGLLLQPGRDEEGLRSPGSHRVTGWAAISFSSRAASSSSVSPSSTRFPPFRMRLGCVFLKNFIKVSPDVEGLMQKEAS
jgi:hypothetical protein